MTEQKRCPGCDSFAAKIDKFLVIGLGTAPITMGLVVMLCNECQAKEDQEKIEVLSLTV